MIDKSLDQFLPKQAHEYLFDIIYNILAIKRQGLLSVGFLLALYFGSSGMKTLMKGFDKAYDSTFRTRSWLNFELTAVALTIVLALMLIISVVLIVLGKQVLGAAFNFLELSEYASQVIKYASYIVVGFLFYLMISIIYKYGPSMKKRTSIFNPGAYLATLVMFLISVLFSYFVDNFGKYNELYGSIGALIVLMIWLQINAVILLIGFELNTSIAVNKDLSVLPENQEENPKEKP
jgi:membrane protein